MNSSLINPTNAPLTEQQLDYIDETLLELGNDDSILCVSELDGFLTAIVSGPNMIPPSRWFPDVWGGAGREPEWENQAQFQQFMGLVMQHMNDVASTLMESPTHFEALFKTNPNADKPLLIAEEWCFGYMRGVDLDDWSSLPVDMETWLYAIELHGREHNFEVLETLTLAEHQQTVREIEPAVRKLHAYWLSQRTPNSFTGANLNMGNRAAPTVVRSSPKVGRNDPCPCGSGKKFKKCCLH